MTSVGASVTQSAGARDRRAAAASSSRSRPRLRRRRHGSTCGRRRAPRLSTRSRRSNRPRGLRRRHCQRALAERVGPRAHRWRPAIAPRARVVPRGLVAGDAERRVDQAAAVAIGETHPPSPRRSRSSANGELPSSGSSAGTTVTATTSAPSTTPVAMPWLVEILEAAERGAAQRAYVVDGSTMFGHTLPAGSTWYPVGCLAGEPDFGLSDSAIAENSGAARRDHDVGPPGARDSGARRRPCWSALRLALGKSRRTVAANRIGPTSRVFVMPRSKYKLRARPNYVIFRLDFLAAVTNPPDARSLRYSVFRYSITAARVGAELGEERVAPHREPGLASRPDVAAGRSAGAATPTVGEIVERAGVDRRTRVGRSVGRHRHHREARATGRAWP